MRFIVLSLVLCLVCYEVTAQHIHCYGLGQHNHAVCSGAGQCVAQDTCHCVTGFTGNQCQIYSCNGVPYNNTSTCSGHGQCISPDICHCNTGYFGQFCQQSATTTRAPTTTTKAPTTTTNPPTTTTTTTKAPTTTTAAPTTTTAAPTTTRPPTTTQTTTSTTTGSLTTTTNPPTTTRAVTSTTLPTTSAQPTTLSPTTTLAPTTTQVSTTTTSQVPTTTKVITTTQTPVTSTSSPTSTNSPSVTNSTKSPTKGSTTTTTSPAEVTETISSPSEFVSYFQVPSSLPNINNSPQVSFNDGMILTSSFSSAKQRNAVQSIPTYSAIGTEVFLQFSVNSYGLSNPIEVWLYRSSSYYVYANVAIDSYGSRYLNIYYNLNGVKPTSSVNTQCDFENGVTYSIVLSPSSTSSTVDFTANLILDATTICTVSTSVSTTDISLSSMHIIIGQANYINEDSMAFRSIQRTTVSTSVGSFGMQSSSVSTPSTYTSPPSTSTIIGIVLGVIFGLLLCIGIVFIAVGTYCCCKRRAYKFPKFKQHDDFNPMTFTATEFDEMTAYEPDPISATDISEVTCTTSPTVDSVYIITPTQSLVYEIPAPMRDVYDIPPQ
jgi:hypothetical protein